MNSVLGAVALAILCVAFSVRVEAQECPSSKPIEVLESMLLAVDSDQGDGWSPEMLRACRPIFADNALYQLTATKLELEMLEALFFVTLEERVDVLRHGSDSLQRVVTDLLVGRLDTERWQQVAGPEAYRGLQERVDQGWQSVRAEARTLAEEPTSLPDELERYARLLRELASDSMAEDWLGLDATIGGLAYALAVSPAGSPQQRCVAVGWILEHQLYESDPTSYLSRCRASGLEELDRSELRQLSDMVLQWVRGVEWNTLSTADARRTCGALRHARDLGLVSSQDLDAETCERFDPPPPPSAAQEPLEEASPELVPPSRETTWSPSSGAEAQVASRPEEAVVRRNPTQESAPEAGRTEAHTPTNPTQGSASEARRATERQEERPVWRLNQFSMAEGPKRQPPPVRSFLRLGIGAGSGFDGEAQVGASAGAYLAIGRDLKFALGANLLGAISVRGEERQPGMICESQASSSQQEWNEEQIQTCRQISRMGMVGGDLRILYARANEDTFGPAISIGGGMGWMAYRQLEWAEQTGGEPVAHGSIGFGAFRSAGLGFLISGTVVVPTTGASPLRSPAFVGGMIEVISLGQPLGRSGERSSESLGTELSKP